MIPVSKGFFDDGSKLSYPDADRLVDRYIDAMAGTRVQTTTTHVLEWDGMETSAHNQKRVHDALSQCCVQVDEDWRGRTVFQLTADADTR